MTAQQKTHSAPDLYSRINQPLNGTLSISANSNGIEVRMNTATFPVGKDVFVEWTTGPNSNWSKKESTNGSILTSILDYAVYKTQEGKTAHVTYTVDSVKSKPATVQVVA